MSKPALQSQVGRMGNGSVQIRGLVLLVAMASRWHTLPALCCLVVAPSGCILYELLCLRVPFEGGDLPRLINKILRTSYPRPPAKYSKEVHQLVDSMLQKDPKVGHL